MATCGPSVSVSSTSGPSSETSPSSGESTPTSLGETSPAAWPDECLDVTTVSEDMIPIAPILQDLQSTESPSHSDSQDSEDVISDVAAELLAETLDFFIEVSNIFANLISDTSEEKPCICTKYVVREGEDGYVQRHTDTVENALPLGSLCPALDGLACGWHAIFIIFFCNFS